VGGFGEGAFLEEAAEVIGGTVGVDTMPRDEVGEWWAMGFVEDKGGTPGLEKRQRNVASYRMRQRK
jgi:hypothetical protein